MLTRDAPFTTVSSQPSWCCSPIIQFLVLWCPLTILLFLLLLHNCNDASVMNHNVIILEIEVENLWFKKFYDKMHFKNSGLLHLALGEVWKGAQKTLSYKHVSSREWQAWIFRLSIGSFACAAFDHSSPLLAVWGRPYILFQDASPESTQWAPFVTWQPSVLANDLLSSPSSHTCMAEVSDCLSISSSCLSYSMSDLHRQQPAGSVYLMRERRKYQSSDR